MVAGGLEGRMCPTRRPHGTAGAFQVHTAVALRDGSIQGLDPRFSLTYLSCLSNQAEDPFTELGELDSPAEEEARRAGAEIAGRIGIPLKEHEERGSLAPSRAGGGK